MKVQTKGTVIKMSVVIVKLKADQCLQQEEKLSQSEIQEIWACKDFENQSTSFDFIPSWNINSKVTQSDI